MMSTLQSPPWCMVLITLVCHSCTAARIEVPGMHQACYERVGHLDLGIITPLHLPGDSSTFCSSNFYGSLAMQIMESYVYAIDAVNANPHLLPNTTLGFVVLDDCFWDMAALSKALYFLPVSDAEHMANSAQPDLQVHSTTVTYDESITNPTNNSFLNTSSSTSYDPLNTSDTLPLNPTTGPATVGCEEGTRQFDVVGVMGLSNSRKAVMVSSLLGVFHIPVVGTLATSDELSDKSRYEYFLRVVSPDTAQARAMLDFIADLGWTYISLIYTEGSYGENGARLIERYASSRGICIAYENMIDSHANGQDIERIVSDIANNPRARVVVLMTSYEHSVTLYDVIEDQGLIGEYIWVAGDSIGARLSTMADGTVGTFGLQPVFGSSPEYDDYFNGLTPQNNPENPWMRKYWEDLYECSWDTPPGINTTSCWDVADQPYVTQTVNPLVSKSMDSVLTYAHALHALISDRCPSAFGNTVALNECIKGQDLLAHLKNASFQGVSGYISFDQNGDMLGSYEIVHRSWTSAETVGVWNSLEGDTGELRLDAGAIDWSVYRPTEDPERQMFGNSSGVPIPTSDCSDPCGPRQYYIMKEVSCCWECYECRENEFLVNNFTDCEPCPDAKWPDPENATRCLPIPPTFLDWNTPLSAVLTSLALLGDVLWMTSAALYIRHWHMRLIKASSRQLSVIILFGIFMAYNAMFIFIGKPRDEMCAVQRYSFNLSVTLIYAPLLMKTSRVYRIFSAGKRGKGTPPLTSNFAQSLLTVLLILLQVALSVATAIFEPPEAKLRMRVSTEPEAELFCDWPINAFLGPLSLNLLLIVATAAFGFMVRKLPQNFNESWYIFVSVSTTSFLWLVFLPTYFTTFYAHHQSVLLASCLIINATVTLMCLYMPKYYALYFVEEDKMTFATMTSSSVTPGAHPT